MSRYCYQRNRKRREKLLNKLQKARAVDQLEEVQKLPSWNRRFGAVCRLRSQRKGEAQR
jgi:hypothetical protein